METVNDVQSIRSFISKCWLSWIYSKLSHFYAFGNTQMKDFLQDLQLSDDVDVLFLDVGDIRHLVKTVAALQRRPAGAGRLTSARFI